MITKGNHIQIYDDAGRGSTVRVVRCSTCLAIIEEADTDEHHAALHPNPPTPMPGAENSRSAEGARTEERSDDTEPAGAIAARLYAENAPALLQAVFGDSSRTYHSSEGIELLRQFKLGIESFLVVTEEKK